MFITRLLKAELKMFLLKEVKTLNFVILYHNGHGHKGIPTDFGIFCN